MRIETKAKQIGKGLAAALCFSVIVATAAGCGAEEDAADTLQTEETAAVTLQSEETAAYRTIVDDYAQIILAQDADSALYDDALECVSAYVEDTEAVSLKETQEQTAEIYAELEERLAACGSYEMDDAFRTLLTENGIDPEEYQLNADQRAVWITDYLKKISQLQEWMEEEAAGEFSYETLTLMVTATLEEQRVLRACDYYGVNYWFAGWDETQVAYVETQVLDLLQSFAAEDAEWIDDRDAVEETMNQYLDELDVLVEELETQIGDDTEALYELQNQLE